MNFKYLTCALVISILFTGCKHEDAPIHGLLIKGTVPAGKKSGTAQYDDGSALSEATKLIVFNSSGGYELFHIENNSFTAEAMPGTAPALVFLREDHSFIGCLQAGGLNVLPLVSLRDGDNTVIDLSSLTLEGTSVIPANNPIGSVINLNADEIERYRQLGAFYESLSNNIDADQDGIADLISKKELFISTMFDIYSGKCGIDYSPAEVVDSSGFFVNYTVRICGGKALAPANQALTLTGPQAEPYGDIIQYYYTTAPDGFISFFRRHAAAPQGYPFGSAFLPFGNGTYNIAIDNKTYALTYSNINVKYFFVVPVPTVHTGANNEVVSITLEYNDTRGNPVNPENFIYQTNIMLKSENNPHVIEQIGTLWESPHAKTNTELFTFVPGKSINVSEIYIISVGYIDLVGNAYGFEFYKK
jgi:hypothetical protein